MALQTITVSLVDPNPYDTRNDIRNGRNEFSNSQNIPPNQQISQRISQTSSGYARNGYTPHPMQGNSRPSTPNSVLSTQSGYSSRSKRSLTPNKISNSSSTYTPSNVSVYSINSSTSSRSGSTKRPQSAPIRKRGRAFSNRSNTSMNKKLNHDSGSTSSSVYSSSYPHSHTFNGEITVLSRFRPLIFPQVDPEPAEVAINFEQTEEGSIITLNDKKIQLHKDMICLENDVTQESLYSTYIKRQVSKFALNGNTGCVLLYGKTGSGKTYTAGVSENEILKGNKDATRVGIIPRALKDVFSLLEQEYGVQDQEGDISASSDYTGNVNNFNLTEKPSSSFDNIIDTSSSENAATQSVPQPNNTDKDFRISQDSDFMLHLSLIEIYGKDVYDMLSDSKDKKKRKLECQAFGSLFYPCYADEKQDPVNSRVRYRVKSYKDAIKLIRKGIKRREVSEHNENKHSSRSHCLMFVHLTRNSKIMTPHTTSTFVVADLCGMEYIKKTTSNAREASAINASLTFLKDILVIMSQKNSNISFEIKFRYHPLCKLLKCCMVSAYHPTAISLIVCCTASLRDLNETTSSLKFANMASQIQISTIQAKTTASQAMFDKKALEAEMASLRHQLNLKMDKIRRLQQELTKAKVHKSFSQEDEDEIGENELKKELKKLQDLRTQIIELQNLKQQLDFEIEEYRKLQEENKKMQSERKQLIQQQKISDMQSQNMKGVIDAFCSSMQEIVTLTSNNAESVVEQFLGDLQFCLQPTAPGNTINTIDGKEELERAIQTIHQLPENLRTFKSKYQEILKTSLKNALQTQKDKFKEILDRVHHRHEDIVKKLHKDIQREKNLRTELESSISTSKNQDQTLEMQIKNLESLLQAERKKNAVLQNSLKRAKLTIQKKDELLNHFESLESEIDDRFSISESP